MFFFFIALFVHLFRLSSYALIHRCISFILIRFHWFFIVLSLPMLAFPPPSILSSLRTLALLFLAIALSPLIIPLLFRTPALPFPSPCTSNQLSHSSRTLPLQILDSHHRRYHDWSLHTYPSHHTGTLRTLSASFTCI